MMALISDSAAVGALFEAKRMKLFMTQLPPSHGTATARLVAARESELQLPANEQLAARTTVWPLLQHTGGRCVRVQWRCVGGILEVCVGGGRYSGGVCGSLGGVWEHWEVCGEVCVRCVANFGQAGTHTHTHTAVSTASWFRCVKLAVRAH